MTLRNALLIPVVSAVLAIPAFAQKADDKTEQLVRENFDVAAQQYTKLLQSMADVAEKNRQPRRFENGKLVTIRPRDWTSGFFPGSLWLLHEYTGDAKWRDAAREYTARLESIKDYKGTHDLGFMIGCSYGNGLRLTNDASYRDIMLKGAESLASRFNPCAGVIRSWDHGYWTFPVIIDNMMNLEFLFWASRESGNPRYREIAISHAQTTLANHFREDGSSYHVVDYDPGTGKVLFRHTKQGYAHWSPWARGQAWGLYGFTMMYRETRNPAYLEQAQRIALFILHHNRLPKDKIPYWDFDAPDIPNAPRDASAAAIIASALIELSDYTTDAKFSKWYLDTARKQLLSLSSPAYRAKVGENGGFILMHSVGHLPGNSEIDVPLNYADYYFLEALLRYRAKMSGKPAVPAPVN
ncbi:unsaturated chondroitin disaccharide hydrolase [Ereboglobus sp. PH5-5]|uniref:glycoside hydrolase family 88 protein n=1 Tax=unclassified Ereboglobus TaxID=2626932 RepID=UPI00240757B2|nr:MULTISPECIES: glycoside hydrolase family 88 protein [unclassified Ereboglobus]MDF9828360.1 unsaturated chondroitin disaccharide hydrolase [Ereboglobus sp. PH5-10]MDF9833672.1 unsaturated chondroitin disaccharide hydrolase [Ereboglobus sp. PH5-5]